MSEEKIHQPTGRKIKKAKEKGEIPQSPDFASALFLMGSTFALWWLGGDLYKSIKRLLQYSLSRLSSGKVELERLLHFFAWTWIELLLIFFLLAYVSHVVQTGFIWKRKEQKKGKRALSFSFLFKIVLFFLVALGLYFILPSKLAILAFSRKREEVFFRALAFLLFSTLTLILFFGIGDYLLKLWSFKWGLRMTKEEIKRERKESEGDPHIKGEIKKRRSLK